MLYRLKRFYRDHEEAIVVGAIGAVTNLVTIAVYKGVVRGHDIIAIDTFCDGPAGEDHYHPPLTVIATKRNGRTWGGQTSYDPSTNAIEGHKISRPIITG